MLLVSDLMRIVATGGGLIIDLKKETLLVGDLIRIAAVAASSGTTIIIRNPNFLLVSDLIRIASAGRGRIIFEL